MSVPLKLGEDVPLSLTLATGNVDRFVRATVKDPSGSPVSGSPFTLPHIGLGTYELTGVLTMPNETYLKATFEVFEDAGFTTLDTDNGNGEELYNLVVIDPEIAICLDQIKGLLQILVDGGLIPDLTGTVEEAITLVAKVQEELTIKGFIPTEDELKSMLSAESTVTGETNIDNIIGEVKDECE